ncbi:MAG: acyl carrier protein [Oscillospiraceae bacterium]|jgi:acyl carrier protein|nr:acyl carrier protein [Oscillospiraceae bacterium]
MSAFDQVAQLISRQLKIDASKVALESRLLEDLHADSANVMMLIMDLEDACGVMMEDEALMQMRTVGDIVNYIEKNTNK